MPEVWILIVMLATGEMTSSVVREGFCRSVPVALATGQPVTVVLSDGREELVKSAVCARMPARGGGLEAGS